MNYSSVLRIAHARALINGVQVHLGAATHRSNAKRREDANNTEEMTGTAALQNLQHGSSGGLGKIHKFLLGRFVSGQLR